MRTAAMMVALFIACSHAGCVGLLPMREAIEEFRGPPGLDVISKTTWVNHTFDSLDPLNSQFSANVPIVIPESARAVRLNFIVEMDLEQFSEMTGDFRYASYQFLDPGGVVKWESNATGSVQEPQLVLTSPDSGTWRLLVDARGYGFELSNLATSKDKVSVWVIVETSELVYSDEN